MAFAFGLLHGFGFAGALHEIGLPQSDIPLALLLFNVGVEVGQLIFILAVLAVISLVRRIPVALPAWSWTAGGARGLTLTRDGVIYRFRAAAYRE